MEAFENFMVRGRRACGVRHTRFIGACSKAGTGLPALKEAGGTDWKSTLDKKMQRRAARCEQCLQKSVPECSKRKDR
jgi:hypothetical protein